MPKEFKHIPLEIKAEDIKEDGSFQGYGSLSDKTPDSYGDVLAKGAFKETLLKGGRNRTGIPMLWQHNSSKIPGVWKSMKEDNIGLAVDGQLALKTTLGNDVYEVMKLGAELKSFQLGMSIGYDVKEFEVDKREDGKRIRTLKKVELWELSIVTFPAKIGAGIETVKCALEEAKDIREIENALRESGHTKSEAQWIIKVIKESLRESEIEEQKKKDNENALRESKIFTDGMGSVLNSLKKLNKKNGYKEKNDFSGILN